MFNPFLFAIMYLIFEGVCWIVKIKKYPDWRHDDGFLCDLHESIQMDLAYVLGILLGYFVK